MSSKCFIIAIAGGSGSGKTTLARHLSEHFGGRGCALLGQDSYYIDQSRKFDRDGGSVNFDHPSALEFSLMARHLKRLKSGQDIDVPIYDFETHKRLKNTEHVAHHPFIIVDGTLVLSQPELCALFDEAVFLEVEESVRYQRRLHRDVHERGRTPEGVREQFVRQVKTMHDQFVEPSKTSCSLLVRDNVSVASVRRASNLHDEILDSLQKLVTKT